MNDIDHIGFDVHKRTITYSIKAADGSVIERDTIGASRSEWAQWARQRKAPWQGAMEATLFTGWIYDCDAICCQCAIWPRRRSASCGGCCATATRSCARRSG